MKKRHLLPLLILTMACESRDPQNSAFCGMTMMASGNRVLDQLVNLHAILEQPPEEMMSGQVPTRVLGYPVGHSLPAAADSGRVALGYQGEGLPQIPGFGLALVDDSSEVFRGVVVFDPEPPQGYPEIGTISDATGTLPLFGLRIHWTSVNSEQCPLFPTDSAATDAEGA